jgi:hypothetical protein
MRITLLIKLIWPMLQLHLIVIQHGKERKKNKYAYQQIKDLRRRRVRSLERFKDSPKVENSHSGILFTPIGAPCTRVI